MIRSPYHCAQMNHFIVEAYRAYAECDHVLPVDIFVNLTAVGIDPEKLIERFEDGPFEVDEFINTIEALENTTERLTNGGQ